MLKMLLKLAVMIIVLSAPHFTAKYGRKIKSFCVGFCIAEAVSGLCGRCAWTYSVVFGELFGFIMLAVTAAGAIGLFYLLSGENGSMLLNALYILFSSAGTEYLSGDTPIIKTISEGVRLGCVGMSERKIKHAVLMAVCAFAGQLWCMTGTQIPASFSAISCCALLCAGIKSIDADMLKYACCIGAVSACLLAYL